MTYTKGIWNLRAGRVLSWKGSGRPIFGDYFLRLQVAGDHRFREVLSYSLRAPGDLGDNVEVILSLSRSYVNSPQQPERLRSAKEPGSREGGPGVAPGGPSMATFQSETGNCVTMEPALDLLRLWNGTPIDENHGGLSMCTPSFWFLFFLGGLCFFQPRNPGVTALKKKESRNWELVRLASLVPFEAKLGIKGFGRWGTYSVVSWSYSWSTWKGEPKKSIMIAGYCNLQVEDWGIAKQKINNLEFKKRYEKVIKKY